MTLRPFLRILLVCTAFALGSPAAFAIEAADTAALAGDDFDAKLAAIDHLAAAGDDGKLLLQADDGSTKDALSGAAVQAGDAQPVRLNNLLRSKVANALSGLDLASPELATRTAAIDALRKNPDASLKPLIDKARAKESDATLKRRLDALWAIAALHDADPAKRLEAVTLLAARPPPPITLSGAKKYRYGRRATSTANQQSQTAREP